MCVIGDLEDHYVPQCSQNTSYASAAYFAPRHVTDPERVGVYLVTPLFQAMGLSTSSPMRPL